MSVFIEELIARLALDTDEASFRQGDASIEKTGVSLRQMAAIATAAFSAVQGAVAGMVTNYAHAGQEIDRLSRVSRASTEEFQRNAAATRTVGIEQEKLADIYKDVNDRVGDFLTTGAGPMADFFEFIGPKVGVTAESFKKLSGPESLQLFVSSLEKANVSQQEMTFYMEAMASDSTLLIPLLRDGGKEMRRLGDAAAYTGAIMSEEAVASAKQFSLQMDNLQDSLAGVRNVTSAELLPTITKLVTETTEFLSVNREIIKSSIVVMFRAATVALKALAAAAGLFVAYKLGVAFIALTAAVRAFSVAAVIARGRVLALNAALLIIPIAIGLALAGIALLSEDLFTFFSGGDSLIGRFIDKFPSLGKAMEYPLKMLKNIADIVMGLVHLDFSYAGEAFGRIVDMWRETIMGFVGWIGSAIPDGVKSIFGLGGAAIPIAANAGAPTLSAPVMPNALQGAVSNSKTNNVTQQDNRTITLNGVDFSQVKQYLGEKNSFAAKTLDTGYDY